MVQDSALRCPAADPALRREARRSTAPPVPDTKAPDGTPAVSADALKAKIDEFRVGEARKNKALSRALDEHDRCRDGGAAEQKIARR